MVRYKNFTLWDYTMGKRVSDGSSVHDKQVIIFTSNSIVAHQHLADLMPFFSETGIKPVVFFTPDCKSSRANIPSLKKYTQYEDGVLGDVIYPALDSDYSKRPSNLSPTFNEMVRGHNFPSHTIDKLTDDVVKEAIASPNNIGAISLFQDAIFKPDFIDSIKEKGFFWNLHPGLPERSGLYVIFWSLLNGEKRHGYTLHEVDSGIDTGKIVATYNNALDPNKSVLESYVDFAAGGSELIKQALSVYMSEGSIELLDRPAKDSKYFTFPTEEDIALGWERNVRLWGTPQEMHDFYTRLYGDDLAVSAKITAAIADIEGMDNVVPFHQDQTTRHLRLSGGTQFASMNP